MLAACGGGGGGGGGGLGGAASGLTSVSVTFDGDYIIGTSGPDTFSGTSQRDLIVDDAGQNTIHALDGNDYIVASGNVDGGDGNDIIFHNNSGGNDEIHGGDGNDVIAAEYGTIYGGQGDDYIQLNADDGERADFLGSEIFREPADNEVIDKEDLFGASPFSRLGRGHVGNGW